MHSIRYCTDTSYYSKSRRIPIQICIISGVSQSHANVEHTHCDEQNEDSPVFNSCESDPVIRVLMNDNFFYCSA